MKRTRFLILLLLLIVSLSLQRASAQVSLAQTDSVSTGQFVTDNDSLLTTQIKSRHLFGIELVGAGGFGSLNYSYFRNHVMYQIGLGVIPSIEKFKKDNSWLIPIQIQLQNPNYCECTMVNFDVGIWGRIDLTKHNTLLYDQYHAIGLSFKLKNYLKNEKDWIVQFGVYPYYDFNQKKMMTTFGLQISK